MSPAMPALSVLQPEADCVVRGLHRATIHEWTTEYRGPVAIHASSSARRCARYAYFPSLQYDPYRLGVVVGLATLAEVLHYRRDHSRIAQLVAADELLAQPGRASPYMFLWAQPWSLVSPVRGVGQRRLFGVSTDRILTGLATTPDRQLCRTEDYPVGSAQA